MTKQLPIDYTGDELKQAGMRKAIDSAERLNPGWKDVAFKFLCDFAKTTKQSFMAEEVRAASKGIVPEPKNKRSWGGIVARAAHEGLIRKVGHKTVTNAKAHRCFASVWQSV